jgi:hypothetical protein
VTDYTAPTAAALKVINEDLEKDIPHQRFFGVDVHDVALQKFTPQMRQQLAAEIAKAAVDAYIASNRSKVDAYIASNQPKGA